MTLIAIVGSPGSPLGRECDIALDASVEREGCPLDAAPMASVLAAQAIGDALAAAVIARRAASPPTTSPACTRPARSARA